MLAEAIGGGIILTLGIPAFLFLNGRVNRVEDKNGKHLESIDKTLSNQNREIGEIKTIVERIEKNGKSKS